MMRRFVLLLSSLLLISCSPRAGVVEASVALTLTAIAPTPLVPLDRPTSTSVPVLAPNADTPKLAQPTQPPAPTQAPTTGAAATAVPPTANAPTATTPATATPAPTVALAPTATPLPSAPAVGELIFEEKFEAQGPWQIGDAGDSIVSIASGTLTYVQKLPGSFSVRIISRTADNFYSEVSIAPPTNCATLDKYGLIFRAQDVANYYVFQIDCDGRYRVLRFGGTAANPLIDWTASNLITRGARAFNTLGVQAKGNAFAFYINGTQVNTASDTAYTTGRFGLWVGSNITRDLTMKFTGLKAYKLP